MKHLVAFTSVATLLGVATPALADIQIIQNCRSFTHTVQFVDRVQTSDGTACQGADGAWRVTSSPTLAMGTVVSMPEVETVRYIVQEPIVAPVYYRTAPPVIFGPTHHHINRGRYYAWDNRRYGWDRGRRHGHDHDHGHRGRR